MQTNNFLTLSLGNTVFANDVSNVREVLEFREITLIPKTASFVKGVINLRGSVVPVIDLRMKFGMENREPDIDTAIIILEMKNENGDDVVLGAVADMVHEVLKIESSEMGSAPKMGNSINVEFIEAIARRNEYFIFILNIEKIFLEDELINLDANLLNAQIPAGE